MNITYHQAQNLEEFLLAAPESGLDDLTALAKAINPGAEPATDSTMRAFFDARSTLFFAAEGGRIVGSASLCRVARMTGASCGQVEEVAVLESHRSNGISRRLCERLIAYARARGMRRLDLTCHPRREVANILYASLGFEVRETNSRRLELSP